MFLQIISIFSVFSTTVSANTEEKYEVFNKNNLSFQVYSGGVYYIRDKVIPVLREGAISDIDTMKSLNLYDDQIEEIRPGAFHNLPKLRILEIYDNKIEKIEAGVFNNLDLTDLDLSANKISTIDAHAFDNLTNLKFINLANNRLRQWNVNWFAKTASLRSIHVSYNSLEEVPADAIGGPKQVYEVTWDSPFYIFLGGNRIKRIDDDAFKNLKVVQVLSLSANQIESLNGNFLRNLQINEVYLNSNRIRCLNKDDLQKIFVANLTQVIDNPWDADCLEDVKQWAKIHNRNVQFYL